MNKEQLLEKLAKYASVLEESYKSNNNANARPLYTERFHFFVKFLAAICEGNEKTLREIIDAERHSIGWSFLPGEQGAQAEEGWADFIKGISVNK